MTHFLWYTAKISSAVKNDCSKNEWENKHQLPHFQGSVLSELDWMFYQNSEAVSWKYVREYVPVCVCVCVCLRNQHSNMNLLWSNCIGNPPKKKCFISYMFFSTEPKRKADASFDVLPMCWPKSTWYIFQGFLGRMLPNSYMS